MQSETRVARVTVDLGDRSLLRRLKMAAVENDMTIREIAVEAIEYWLDHQEDIEDELARRKVDRVAAESSGEYVAHEEGKRTAAQLQ